VVEIGGHIVEFHDDAVTAYVEVLVVKRLVDVSYDWERETNQMNWEWNLQWTMNYEWD
jgi:hypothetical protein